MEELDISCDYALYSGSSLPKVKTDEQRLDEQIWTELALEAADDGDDGMFEEYRRRINEL